MTELIAGAALGLAGSAHCVAMCGPLTLAWRGSLHAVGAGPAAPWPGERRSGPIGTLALYHAGRLAMYAVAGGAAGLAGHALVSGGMGRGLAIAAGLTLVVMAARRSRLVARSTTSGRLVRVLGQAMQTGARHMTRWPCAGALVAGALNAWLPCGLLYAALTAAAGLGSPWHAALFMTMFGLGTVPALATVWLAAAAVGPGLRRRLRFATPVVLLILGVLLIARGVTVDEPTVAGAIPHAHWH